jgi:RNA polymerase sigma-70 factor, ECF subfamily
MQTQERYVDAFGNPIPQEATQAFGQVLSSELPMLHRRAYRLLGNAADAEDAVQDALLAAYTHLNQFKGKSRMSTWMTTIVHNSARMQLRTRRRHVHAPLDFPMADADEKPLYERLADHRPSPEQECCNSDLSERLMRVQRQLSPTLRRAFQLRDVDGLSIREAANILGVPTGTVKAQSARARKKVLELLRRSRVLSGFAVTGEPQENVGVSR